MAYQISNLPSEIRQQVEDYIEFLLSKYSKKVVVQKKPENPRLYAYGLYKGKSNYLLTLMRP
ncbi:MAG: DUF2281 domain-containing protein [Bacteroidia bacterium]